MNRWIDNYWADYLHLANGKVVAVVEGFKNIDEANEFVEKAKAAGVKFRRKQNVDV